MHSNVLRKSFASLMAVLLASTALLACLCQTNTAFAATDYIDAEPDELQLKIEESAEAYDEATANVETLEQQIQENTDRIEEIEAAIPDQQEKSAQAMRSLYMMQEEGYSLFNMVLSCDTLDDFLNTVEYLSCYHNANMNELMRLSSLKEELETTEQELADSMQAAETEKIRAEDALKNAQEAREEALRKAEEEAAAQAAAAAAALEAEKQAEAKAAEEAAAAATPETPAAEEQPAPPSGGDEAAGGDANVPTPSEVDWSSDKAGFVAQWAPRIDAYLAGSPLSGQGTTFASAAWDNGVDPRWSPAISNTESSKGLYCFLPHNAWGWGSVSWGSWEEAINAHVRGLARGYGYTISVDAAKTYCPPNWEHWYNSTLAQMNMI